MNSEERTAFGKYLMARANNIHQELEEIDELLNVIGKPFTEELTYDLKNIKTVRTEGNKGYYEKAEEQDNQDYRNLVADLKAHNGKLTKDGNFVWLFSDNKTVGMKPSKR